MMDDNNWRPPPPGAGAGGGAAPETDDWRSHLPQGPRHHIVNMIMETLKRHLPFHGPEGLQDLRKNAVRLEEKIFRAALNKPDYLQKISLKILQMEPMSQNSVANSMPFNSAANSSMQPQLQHQVPSIANPVVSNQSQAHQQILLQNIQNNMPPSGVQGSSSLNFILPYVSGINQTSLPTILNQNRDMQNMPYVLQNSVGNPMGQGLASDMFVNQRWMPGRQQLVSQQQQPQNQQQYLYQPQLQNYSIRKRPQQGNIPHSMMPSHKQQQLPLPPQQNILQPSQIQPPQQFVTQSSAVMQTTGVQTASLTSLQPNRQPSIQQTTQSVLQQHEQSIARHQTQPQQALHQQQTSLQQHQVMPSQQQQPNMQQNQMINQQNNIGDMQQQQHLQPQQQLLSTQNNLLNLHPQQLVPQNNVSGLYQQPPMMSTQSGNSVMQVGEQSVNMLQQPKVLAQEQMPGWSSNLLPGQPSQVSPVQQQLMSQMQPQPGQLPQQVGLQQQQASLQKDMQQRLQPSGSLLQSAQNVMDQQKQLYKSQRGHADTSSMLLDSTWISASPLVAEFSGPDGAHGVASMAVSGKSTVTEQPIECLIRVVKSASPQALSNAVNNISLVVSMVDRIAGSAPGNGSRAPIGEDLVAMTKCHMQARNLIMQDSPSRTRKIRHNTSAMPLNISSLAGSPNDSFQQLIGVESSDLGSTAASSVKRLRSEVNLTLHKEIEEINQWLIDTVVHISDENNDPTAEAAVAEGGEGVIVKCSFNAVSFSPGLKSQYGSAQLSPIQPLWMHVPSNYPNCSPVLLDKSPVEVSKGYEDLSLKAKSRFSISLRGISQPLSLKDIAKTWDNCSRAVILEYAEQCGGGSFSSKYGTWENCQNAT